MMPSPRPNPLTGAILRLALRLAAVGLLAIGVLWLTQWCMQKTAMMQGGGQVWTGLIVLLLLVYALMIAVPFVPGIELGLALMALQGGTVAPWVYLATVVGLTLAYGVGAKLPPDRIAGVLGDLRLTRAAAMVRAVAPLEPQARIELLAARLPPWLAPLDLRSRYILLAVLINLPGNSLIGGGGGIGLLAGLSRIYTPLATVLTFVIAVSPIPLLVWIYGMPILPFFK